jgi:hypothetical protein
VTPTRDPQTVTATAEGDVGIPIQSLVVEALTWALIAAVAACVGAWSKLP